MRVTLLAGVVYRDPHRSPEPQLPWMIAARVAGAGKPLGFTSGPVGFFATGGREHLKSEDSMILATDLDLLNLDELRALTGTAGTRTMLARLYELEGWEGIQRLRGAFAVALWDRRRRELLLAVDRFGIKRLYYAHSAQGLAFASRLAALLAVPGVRQQINANAAYNYLNFEFVPAPYSIYSGIHRLPPGHVLLMKDGEPFLKPYWDLTYAEQPLRVREATTSTYRLVEEAVTRSLQGIKTKEAGAFLSGGTDSSTVLGLMTKTTGERVNAFSIGFKEERYNELSYAELAAHHFGASHYTKIVTPDEALEALPRLVKAFDEPFGNDSALGTFFCAQLARECGITWLLAGDGGDEIFGGNERYRTDRLFARYHRIPAVLRRGLLEPVLLRLPDGGPGLVGRVQRYIRRANLPNPWRFYSYEFFFAQEADWLLSPDFCAAVDLEEPLAIVRAHYDWTQPTSELNRLLYLDLKLTIGDNDLLKVTRTAELAGVGVRFPMLDPPLVEFTATWPVDFKVRGLEMRYLFKHAFQALLPPEILAKRKHGFGVPTSDWLKNHSGFEALARETLLCPRTRQRGYFRPGALEELFRRHATDSTPYYGEILWTVLMFELWHRQHLDGAVAA